MAQSGVARQIADDLWLIDTQFQDECQIIASYLIVGERGLALVDVGAAATVDALLAGVRAAGTVMQRVRWRRSCTVRAPVDWPPCAA